MAAAAFAVSPAFAGDKDKDHACCATGTKMDALVEKCNKDGCTKESMAAFMKSAETILSKEQMATFKAEHDKAHEKKESKT